jgi:hypothetical protein
LQQGIEPGTELEALTPIRGEQPRVGPDRTEGARLPGSDLFRRSRQLLAQAPGD